MLLAHKSKANEFATFAGKCINRYTSSQVQSGLERNVASRSIGSIGPGAVQRALPSEAHSDEGRIDRRGGVVSGKQTLHAEVCREMKVGVQNQVAHTETTRRWGQLSEDEKHNYKNVATARRNVSREMAPRGRSRSPRGRANRHMPCASSASRAIEPLLTQPAPPTSLIPIFRCQPCADNLTDGFSFG